RTNAEVRIGDRPREQQRPRVIPVLVGLDYFRPRRRREFSGIDLQAMPRLRFDADIGLLDVLPGLRIPVAGVNDVEGSVVQPDTSPLDFAPQARVTEPVAAEPIAVPLPEPLPAVAAAEVAPVEALEPAPPESAREEEPAAFAEPAASMPWMRWSPPSTTKPGGPP